MARTIVDVHVIQTVPPSNLNRDDTGSPKTAVYGGKRRARVSSQAWKRATRDSFGKLLDHSDLGVRSKRVVELIGESIGRQDEGLKNRRFDLAADVLKAAGIKTSAPRKTGALPESGYLIFFSARQVERLAELAVSNARAGTAVDRKAARVCADQAHSIDVSLFGRMVTEVPDLNVDAAAQVAHALSVHAVDNEYDYFTAVDDHKRDDVEEDAGAGMIGTVEFNSSTLYRYATVDVNRLRDNLGDPAATRRAVEAFMRAFITSMPTGKQNTFANRTLPDGVVVIVRDTQSINFVGAFEDAVEECEEGGRVAAACRRLALHGRELHEAYNQHPVAAWVVGVGGRAAALGDMGEPATLDDMVTALGSLLAGRLGGGE